MPFERGPPARRGAGLAAHACSLALTLRRGPLRSACAVAHQGPRGPRRSTAGGFAAGRPTTIAWGRSSRDSFSGAGSSSVARRLRQHRFARNRSRPRNLRGSQLRRARFFGGTHRHPHVLAELVQEGDGSTPDLGTTMELDNAGLGVTNRPPSRRPILNGAQTFVTYSKRWQVCWVIRPHHDQPS